MFLSISKLKLIVTGQTWRVGGNDHSEEGVFLPRYVGGWLLLHASSSYQAILHSEALAETDDWEMRVANAYDAFQRIAHVLEVIKDDLEYHEEGMDGVKQLWRRVEGQVEGVLVSLLTELEMRETSGPTLSMAVLPPSLRCEQHSVNRNHRDFIVLRHVFHAASFFSITLNQS